MHGGRAFRSCSASSRPRRHPQSDPERRRSLPVFSQPTSSCVCGTLQVVVTCRQGVMTRWECGTCGTAPVNSHLQMHGEFSTSSAGQASSSGCRNSGKQCAAHLGSRTRARVSHNVNGAAGTVGAGGAAIERRSFDENLKRLADGPPCRLVFKTNPLSYAFFRNRIEGRLDRCLTASAVFEGQVAERLFTELTNCNWMPNVPPAVRKFIVCRHCCRKSTRA
jgi:hypothetical protein